MEEWFKFDVFLLNVFWYLVVFCLVWFKEVYIEWLGFDVIMEFYGGMEGIGLIVIIGCEWFEYKGFVGKLIEICEIKIVGEDGNVFFFDEVGEVFFCFKIGFGIIYYYIGVEVKMIDGGWESLGDFGYMDNDGYLYLFDWLMDMILLGGVNIYFVEVEVVIDVCVGVCLFVVIGLFYEDLGNVIYVIVDVLGGDVMEEILMIYLNEWLVKYKLFCMVEFVYEFLWDDVGKVWCKVFRVEWV